MREEGGEREREGGAGKEKEGGKEKTGSKEWADRGERERGCISFLSHLRRALIAFLRALLS